MYDRPHHRAGILRSHHGLHVAVSGTWGAILEFSMGLGDHFVRRDWFICHVPRYNSSHIEQVDQTLLVTDSEVQT